MPSPLTLPRGTPRSQYRADGSQVAFAFPYPFFAAEDEAVAAAAGPVGLVEPAAAPAPAAK